MQLLTIILLALTFSLCIVNIIVLKWIWKDIDNIDNKCDAIISIVYDEGEKTRQYLKAEIIKSENEYVYYEPAEETKDN